MSDIVFLRVNGEHLHSFRGQPVCVLGRLTDEPTETSFKIETADGKLVECKFKVPIRDCLSQIVEVYGHVDEKGNLNCENYATFEPGQLDKFDLDMYKETIQMGHMLQNHYVTA